MKYPDRNSARGPEEYAEVVRTPGDDEGDAEEGSEINGGTGRTPKSSFGSDAGPRFCGEDLVVCRILYLDFPFPDVVVVGSTGIGVAVLDVSAEPDKEDGTLMEDMERESNGILAFPFDFASSCAFANLNLAVYGVSVLSLDSLDEDGVGDDGREREGESAGVDGVRERCDECASERMFSSDVTSFYMAGWDLT